MTADQIIAKLGLVPHPEEGGYFRETYRSEEQIERSALSPRYSGTRSQNTAIFYLLTENTFSKMHRLKSDEIFHFYLGEPVEMLVFPSEEEYCEPAASTTEFGRHVLGSDLASDQALQLVIPKGCWQGARLIPGGKFALLGCTVSPGFDFEDFSTDAPATIPPAFAEHEQLFAALK